MKRSRRIVLVLSGTLVTSGFVGCERSEDSGDWAPEVSESQTYTNNHYVPGAGYYHAPYHSWYRYPYNWHMDGQGYYHGGTWSSEPHQSPITASQPTPVAAHTASAH